MPARKTKASSTSEHLAADELMNHINKKFGENTLVRASDSALADLPRISTGNFSLDVILNGGLVEGRLHQFRGNFSSTKTTQMHITGREFLTSYEEGCYVIVDAENTTDEIFLQNVLGFTDDQMSRTFLVKPGSGEDACDIAIEVCKMAKKVIVGIDSVDALTPTAEMDDEMAKAGVGPGARMMNKFMRKLIPVMRTDLLSDSPRCTLIMISQLREKIGTMFGDNSTTWGGKGKEFAASTIIKFSRTAWLREGAKKDGYTYGLRMQAELIKCKGPGHGEVAEYSYYKAKYGRYLPGQFNNLESMIEWGVRLELVKKTGRNYKYSATTGTSLADFADQLSRKSKLRAKLKNAIMETRYNLYFRKA